MENIYPTGFHRAQVIDNKDFSNYGRVKVWIPDYMPRVQSNKGIWARPANLPIGGRNKENSCGYIGMSFIPPVGSWVFIFFENGNLNRPYYFGSLQLENTETLPENRVGLNPQEKWVIFKSTQGRCIVVSDDQSDARVEITGEKRQITDFPAGDTNSVYTIDGNQNTILLDERPGKEKVLIRTRKGDFIHVDIDERQLQISFNGDIKVKTSGTMFFEAEKQINIKGKKVNIEGSSGLNLKAGGPVNIDGSLINEQTGAAMSAQGCSPEGGRDT